METPEVPAPPPLPPLKGSDSDPDDPTDRQALRMAGLPRPPGTKVQGVARVEQPDPRTVPVLPSDQ